MFSNHGRKEPKEDGRMTGVVHGEQAAVADDLDGQRVANGRTGSNISQFDQGQLPRVLHASCRQQRGQQKRVRRRGHEGNPL